MTAGLLVTDVSDGFRSPCWCSCGWVPSWRLHTQIAINLGKKIIRISCVRKINVTWILARVFAYSLSFISQILDLIYTTVLIFILIYFEWRDTKNQQQYGWRRSQKRAKDLSGTQSTRVMTKDGAIFAAFHFFPCGVLYIFTAYWLRFIHQNAM